jgi:hypothetical protein
MFAFRMSRPVVMMAPDEGWSGAGEARASPGVYCTFHAGVCGYCRARYNGSSMECICTNHSPAGYKCDWY